jgi:hypothetical protein
MENNNEENFEVEDYEDYYEERFSNNDSKDTYLIMGISKIVIGCIMLVVYGVSTHLFKKKHKKQNKQYSYQRENTIGNNQSYLFSACFFLVIGIVLTVVALT